MSSGRPPSTTHDEIATAALALFEQQGFERTTVDQIAAAAGIGRRTLFRYFPSKNDIVWGDFDWVIERLRTRFRECGPQVAPLSALRQAVVLSNSYHPAQLPGLRIRMTLITTVPALQAHSMLRYADWRNAVAELIAERTGRPADDLVALSVAGAALGTATAAFGRWVGHPEEDLEQCLDRAFELLEHGFAGVEAAP